MVRFSERRTVMNFQSLKNASHAEIVYTHFLSTVLLYHQTPFCASEYSNNPHTKTVIVYKRSPNGNITTKKLVDNNESIEKIKSHLLSDFPYLTIDAIDKNILK